MGWTRDFKIFVRRIVRPIIAEEIHTQIPARVVSYNGTANTCSIQPCIMQIRTEDPNNLETIELPQIDDVPVKMQGSGKLLLSVAPQVDSYGAFYVSEHDLELWISNGGITNPGTSRKFDYSDGWFDPGLYPLKADGDNGLISPAINTDRIGLRTRLGTTEISVLDDGTVEIVATGSSVILDGTNATFHGGSDSAVAYTDLKSAFDALKSDLNALVTAYNAHIHITTATVGTGGPIGVIAPTTSTGSPSAADMSGAEVATVKLP